MADDHKQPYLQPYRKAVEKFGPGFEATLWGTREAQQLRFEVMIELAGFEECVILDAGCGQGDFAAYLLEQDIPFARYMGIDALEEMIQAAIERGLSRCEFQVADFVTNSDVLKQVEADFVCLSGSLNTMDEEMARQLIQAAFEASAQGVVFNFLSDRPHPKWADKDLGPSRRFDTKGRVDWALSKSSRVSFTQDYLDGHDATIMIRHD